MTKKRKQKTSLKDWPKIYDKIKGMRGMTKSAKIRYAVCAAAAPDERWQMNIERCKMLWIWGKGLAGKRKLERLVIAGKDWLPEMDSIPEKMLNAAK